MAVQTVEDRTPLAESYELGRLARDVHIAPGDDTLTLYDTTLVEDDGPGARPLSLAWPTTWETIGGGTQARKLLYVDRPEARKARLVFNGTPTRGETEPLVVTVNGHELSWTWPRDDVEPGGWQVIELPARRLRKGRNEVVFSCRGPGGWWLSIASASEIVANAPDREKVAGTRSQRSTDGGRTWHSGLGPDAAVTGEYMVRLNLDQSRPEGELVGPVIDLAELAGAADKGLAGRITVENLIARAKCHRPKGTAVDVDVRTGDSPLYEPDHWGPWRACRGKRVRPGRKTHRFAQWRVVLTTQHPTVTPSVSAVTLAARVEPAAPGWWAGAAVTEAENPTVRQTSMPFEYERFDEAELDRLRRKHKLDRVVAGAANELEAMRRLRDWVARQFSWAPPGQPYPAWDAHDILSRKDNMCVQSAVCLMQCALAVGMEARFTFGIFPRTTVEDKRAGGHEITEIWSNDFGKWVYMDATSTRNECFIDRRTGVPLGMLEMHDETIRLYASRRPLKLDGNTYKSAKSSRRLRVWKGRDDEPLDGPAPIRPCWGLVHWMPRNNFLGRRRPVPVAQGRIPWSWPGYWLWWDKATPRQPWFVNYTSRRSDIEWTLNQVRYAATAAKADGRVDVRMSTVSPEFDAFLVSTDGGQTWAESGPAFRWDVEPGDNELHMCVRTRAWRCGRESVLRVRR